MNRSARVRAARVLVLLGLALATSGWAAASSCAAVTLGSALATEPTGSTTCPTFVQSTSGCLAVDDALPARELVAPFSGVIVHWGVRLGTETEAQSIRIRVVRRVNAKQFTVIASGPPESVPGGGGTYVFPSRLPIESGDEVGLESGTGAAIEWRAPLPGGHNFEYFPASPLLDGEETPLPTLTSSDTEHSFNVEVEPDCDHDGLGDETQDPDTAACHPPPSNEFTLGKPKRNPRRGFARLPVNVPGPGVLSLWGKGVFALRLHGNLPARSAYKAGTVNLLVKPQPKTKRRLERVGRAKVRITVTYTPTGGMPKSQGKTLVLKMRLH
jgi:hypothetical protein